MRASARTFFEQYTRDLTPADFQRLFTRETPEAYRYFTRAIDLEKLAREPYMPNLAISLHATTEEQRDLLVPINRKYSLAQLMDACRNFPLKKRSRITFEYVMLAGVNDTPADARRLVKLLNGLKAKVNLLPLNEAAGIPYARPSDERVDAFAQILADAHVTVSVRKSRGRDIRAACGQLAVEKSA